MIIGKMKLFLMIAVISLPVLLSAAEISMIITSDRRVLHQPEIREVSRRGLHIRHRNGFEVLTPEDIDPRFHDYLESHIAKYRRLKKRYDKKNAGEGSDKNRKAADISNKVITVTAEGYGKTKDDALYDAMRNAVIKAVGAYVNVEIRQIDEQLRKEIKIISSADIADHKILDSSHDGNEYSVRIEARILPSELQRYYPKLKSQIFSRTDVGNVLQQYESLKSAVGTIPEIFRYHRLYMYKFEKYDRLRHVTDNFSDENIVLKIKFKVSIDLEYYRKFQDKLRRLLESVCLQKKEYDRTAIPNDAAAKLWRLAGLNKMDFDRNDMEYGFIALEELRNRGDGTYSLYLVPNQIVKAIENELSYDRVIMVCALSFDNSVNKIRWSGRINDLRFHYYDQRAGYYGFKVIGNNYYRPLTFVNQMYISGGNFLEINDDWERRFCTYTVGSLELKISKDKVGNLREFDLYQLDTSKRYLSNEEFHNTAESSERNLRVRKR